MSFQALTSPLVAVNFRLPEQFEKVEDVLV